MFQNPGVLFGHSESEDGAIVGYATDQLGILQCIF